LGILLNYKLATRYKIAPNFNLRVLLQPDLERHPYTKFILIIRLLNLLEVLVQVATFNNQKRAIPAKLFGIPQLKQEESQSQHWFYCKIRRQS
jgi:hypothetical protein